MNDTYFHSSIIKCNVRIDNTNKPIQVRAVVVSEGVLFHYLKYLLGKVSRDSVSHSWVTQSNRSIRLLIDYSIAHENTFDNAKEMFDAFAVRVREGTVNDEGYDDTGLRWQATSDDNRDRIIYYITEYSDWLYKFSGGNSALLNPLRKATRAEKIMNLAAYNHIANNSFLKHLKSKASEEQSINEARRVGKSKKNRYGEGDEPQKPFPEDKIWELLSEGFAKKGQPVGAPPEERYNLANVLITMLLHFGGLRTSEPFHIYWHDIIPNKALEQIRVYHPTEGLAPDWWRLKEKLPHAYRRLFLQKKYQMASRWKHPNLRLRAGWKNNVITSKGNYMNVFLTGGIVVKETFFGLFRRYMQVRKEPLKGREHPFLFTNKNGDPLSMESYGDAHKIAVTKIGLSTLLEDGGAKHSHRHAYKQRLVDMGLSKLERKKCLHHSCEESQDEYGKTLGKEEIEKALDSGVAQLEEVYKIPDILQDKVNQDA